MNGATTTTTTTKKESISANKCKQQFQHERTENSKSYKESIESSNEGQWYKLGPIQKGANIKKKLLAIFTWKTHTITIQCKSELTSKRIIKTLTIDNKHIYYAK